MNILIDADGCPVVALIAEEVLILAVVHLGVAGGHDKDGILPHLKAEGLGDTGTLHAHSQSSQFHRGAGDLKLAHTIRDTVGGQVFSYFFHRHSQKFTPVFIQFAFLRVSVILFLFYPLFRTAPCRCSG